MPTTSKRLSLFPESAISVMNMLAEKNHAINLASGYPDFDPPQALIQAAEQALHQGYHQYAPTPGSPRLRSALASKQSRFTGLEIDPDDHVTITCGGTEAMMAVLISICNPGDRVLIFSPFYENYSVDTFLLDAVPVYIPLVLPDFHFDPDELRQAFQEGAKAIIVCNPSNPSGKVFTRDELTTIGRLAQEFDAFVITDEVYEHLVYAPHQHVSMASLPGMFERTITCGSLSKTFAITGWRLGSIIAPQAVTDQFRKVHDYLTLGAPAPLQEAAVAGLMFEDQYYLDLKKQYSEMKDIFLGYLDEYHIEYIPPQGAYFVLADISPFGFKDDWNFCNYLVEKIGVAAVPGSYFFHEQVHHLVRFNFAKSPETLHEAGRRLGRLSST